MSTDDYQKKKAEMEQAMDKARGGVAGRLGRGVWGVIKWIVGTVVMIIVYALVRACVAAVVN